MSPRVPSIPRQPTDQHLVDRYLGGVGGSGAEASRAVAEARVPSPDQRLGNYKTLIQTFFTKPGVETILYQANVPWARLKILLETAGPVVIGTGPGMAPINSGRGALLRTDEELEFDVAAGNKIFIFSTTANRVRLIVQPLPWQEMILGGVVRGFDMLIKTISSLRK